MKQWETYEEVATYLLDQFASEFGWDRVEGKQEINGERSGTRWEIDAKAIRQGGAGFLIVESRRYTKERQSQEKVAALAYRILDTGAAGGIVVSPLGLQDGAQKVAKAENIISVRLDESSTRQEYLLQLLNKVMVGFTDILTLRESFEIELRDKDGNIVRREKSE